MTDDGFPLKIDGALAERLRAFAHAAGQSEEDYALAILKRAVEQPGFGDGETVWNGASAETPDDSGFDEDSEAYADYIDRICDEAERTGGVPWEQVQARLRNFGQSR